MKLGVIMSDYRTGSDVLERLTAEKLGIILSATESIMQQPRKLVKHLPSSGNRQLIRTY